MAILYQDPLSGRLINQWINEHMLVIQRLQSLLILDVFEHAFMIDYGLKRPDYIASFFKTSNGSRGRTIEIIHF